MGLVRFSAALLVAVVLHVFLGWQWTIGAGLLAGVLSPHRGWLFGALAVGADWLLLVIFNYVVDARAVGAMTEALASILGNMPSFVVVAITLFIGLLLGAVGGAAGTQLRRMFSRRRRTATA